MADKFTKVEGGNIPLPERGRPFRSIIREQGKAWVKKELKDRHISKRKLKKAIRAYGAKPTLANMERVIIGEEPKK